jgi:hypothetical protein
MECVAAAVERAGHEVRLVDLQVFKQRELQSELIRFHPDAVGFSVNYLANVPEVIDLAKLIRKLLPKTFVFCGGHSISFIAGEVLAHGDGAIDAIVTGEGETTVPALLNGLPKIDGVAGVTTLNGNGPRATMTADINAIRPARHLTRRRRKYFIGERPSSFHAAARGIARFAAPGRFMAAATGRRTRRFARRKWRPSASRMRSSSMTSPSSTPSMGWPSPTKSNGAKSANAITWKPAATC